MKESYYFKTKEHIVRYGISPLLIKECDSFCTPITEEEYNTAMSKIEEEAAKEIQLQEEAEQSYIEQLEKENASLLYQILTGEELADV